MRTKKSEICSRQAKDKNQINRATEIQLPGWRIAGLDAEGEYS